MGFDDYDLAKFVVVAKCNMEKCHKRMQNFVTYTAKYKVIFLVHVCVRVCACVFVGMYICVSSHMYISACA